MMNSLLPTNITTTAAPAQKSDDKQATAPAPDGTTAPAPQSDGVDMSKHPSGIIPQLQYIFSYNF